MEIISDNFDCDSNLRGVLMIGIGFLFIFR